MNAAYSIYMLGSVLAVIGVYCAPWLDFRGAGRVLRPKLAHAHPPPAQPQSYGPAAIPGATFVGRADDAEFDPAAEKARRRLARRRRALDRLVIEPRADFTVLIALGGLAAMALGALLGFLSPLALKPMLDGSAHAATTPLAAAASANLAALPFVAEEPMGRLAQIVGLAAGVAIALRMLRVFMGAALCAALALGALATVNFVIDRPILALMGA
ncbi:MAG: hypothetical protein AAGM38_12810 [Pseudomonadota bacterium]